MSERHAQNGEANAQAIKARPLADLRYPARSVPPLPDVLMQEAHKLSRPTRRIANIEQLWPINWRALTPRSGHFWPLVTHREVHPASCRSR
jgi:hypothetical protein